MGLETGTYISDLVTTNPLGSDAKSTADDHLRLLKTTLKNSVVGFAGTVIVAGTDGTFSRLFPGRGRAPWRHADPFGGTQGP